MCERELHRLECRPLSLLSLPAQVTQSHSYTPHAVHSQWPERRPRAQASLLMPGKCPICVCRADLCCGLQA